MVCTDLRETEEERTKRIDALLREMVVSECLDSLEQDRPPRRFNFEEIGDFCGVGAATILRIERKALKKIRGKMVN